MERRKPLRRRSTRKGRSDYCDQLLRPLVHARDRVCQMCGGDAGLQVAHFFGRRHKSVAWDLDNVALLCSGPGSNNCHARLDANELDKGAWVRDRLGPDRYAALVERWREPWDKDYDAVIARLHAGG